MPERPRDCSPRDGSPWEPRVLRVPADRLPPQNLEAEAGVLGSMLLDNACIPDVLAELDTSDFYRASHATIFGAIRDLHESGRPVDAVMLFDHMEHCGTYEQAGGDDYLAKILNGVPHSANAVYYAGIVREASLVRGAIEASNRTLREAYDREGTADELLERAELRLMDLSRGRSSGGPVSSADALADAVARLRRRAVGEEAGLATGFRDVDGVLDGLKPGQLVLVAARPSQGKSAFALNVCDHAAASGVASAFVSLEMSMQEISDRLLSARTGIAARRFRDSRYFTEDEWARTERAVAGARDLPIWFDAHSGPNVSRVAASCRRLVASRKVGLIVVDYLQLMEGDGDSRQEVVARISRYFKGLARSLDVPVVALSQLNRESERRENRRPRLSDLRESGALEQDADVVVLLHRPEFYDPNDQPGVAEVYVAKNRNGPTDMIRLAWRKEFMSFADFAGDVPAPAGPAEDVDWEEPFG